MTTQVELRYNDLVDFFEYLILESGFEYESGMDISELGVIMACFNPDNPSEMWKHVSLKLEYADDFVAWATEYEIEYYDITPSGE